MNNSRSNPVFRLKFAPVPVVAQEAKAGPIVAEVMGMGTLEARFKTTVNRFLACQPADNRLASSHAFDADDHARSSH